MTNYYYGEKRNKLLEMNVGSHVAKVSDDFNKDFQIKELFIYFGIIPCSITPILYRSKTLNL